MEEGITEIPQAEFAGRYPAEVPLPWAPESPGFNAVDLLFAGERIANTVKQNKQ